MGFRPRVLVPNLISYGSMLPVPNGYTPANLSGGAGGTTGRLYLAKAWLPVPKTLAAWGAYFGGVGGNIQLGIYRGSPAAGLSLVGKSQQCTPAGATPSGTRFALTTPFTIPAGTFYVAYCSTLRFPQEAIPTTILMTPGLLYYIDGVVVANEQPASIAAGAVIDVATTPVNHVGFPGQGYDMEFS